MDLLEDLRMSLYLIKLYNSELYKKYIIYKILVLIKNHLNCLKDAIFVWFFKKYNKLLFL